jgi:hypothetical protein
MDPLRLPYTSNTNQIVSFSQYGGSFDICAPQEVKYREVDFKLWRVEAYLSARDMHFFRELGAEHRDPDQIVVGWRNVLKIKAEAAELGAEIDGVGLPRLLQWALDAFAEFNPASAVHVERDYRSHGWIFWQGEYRGSI